MNSINWTARELMDRAIIKDFASRMFPNGRQVSIIWNGYSWRIVEWTKDGFSNDILTAKDSYLAEDLLAAKMAEVAAKK